jgi:hypothetical protein
MRTLRARWTMVTCALFLGMAIAVPAHAQTTNPDSGLFTEYHAVDGHEFYWDTCGKLPSGAEDCYGAGNLGHFTNACAIMQSASEAIDASTVVRYIYVLDAGRGSEGASLVSFRRTDSISEDHDAISIDKEQTVSLPGIAAGNREACQMVQNPTNVYAGVKQSATVVSINKKSYQITNLDEESGALISITADSYGFVSIDRRRAAEIYGPDGERLRSRGAGGFLINPIDSVYPANHPN